VQAPRAHVSEVQRARMLACAARVIVEHGYEQMSVARIAHGARVSRRTFYDLFEDREDCFLAMFDDALARASGRVLDAYNGAGEHDRDWRERVRAGLEALLRLFDEEPQVSSLLIVNALRGGPRILERRAEALARVSGAIQESGSRAHAGRESPSPLSGEGVVGGVLAVIHTRLTAKRSGTLLGLLNPLTAVIVLPYLGPAAAQRELQRPAPKPVRRRAHAGAGANGARVSPAPGKDPLADLPMRLTYRTLCVLETIADRPGASNREVADLAGITDQGQVSKLLARLEGLGLIGNAGQRRQPTGEPNAWRLTPRGEELQKTTRTRTDEP
jgi:AcrR family transcriptional regulator